MVGKFDMPVLRPVTESADPHDLVPFNAAMTEVEPEKKWYHFYIDDYQFERIWRAPKRYLDILRRFEGGITPDFSLYLNMPVAQQVWNCWRNRVMAYWMQEMGLNVIPNVPWSDEMSLEWALDGIPEDSVLAMSTQGAMCSRFFKHPLLNGLHELATRKRPRKLVVYGRFLEAWKERFPMPIVVCKTFTQSKWGR